MKSEESGGLAGLFRTISKTQFASVYALVVTLFGMTYILALTFGTVPEANQGYVNTILGFVLGTMIATAVAWVLGSSKGSADKNALLTGTKPDQPEE